MVIVDGKEVLSEEEKRLRQDRDRTKYWKRWGPYVAERQWATGSSSTSRCIFALADFTLQFERIIRESRITRFVDDC
jgi:hypothetical protein